AAYGELTGSAAGAAEVSTPSTACTASAAAAPTERRAAAVRGPAAERFANAALAVGASVSRVAAAAPAFLHPQWDVPSSVRSVFSLRSGGVSLGRYASLNLGS